MRRIRVVGLCLVAVFASGAIASATASAEAPEFGQCLKIVKGTEKKLSLYDSAKCIKHASEDAGTEAEKLKKANYEWVPGPKAGENSFTRAGGVVKTLGPGGESFTCQSEEATGHYIVGGNNKEEELNVTFKGCQSGGLSCTTAGRAPGELVLNPLIGIVGFETEPKEGDTTRHTVLQLHAATTGGHFIDFQCTGGTLKTEWRGNGPKEGVLVPIKNDAMKFEETLKYTQSKGIQKPTKWFPPLVEYGETQFLEENIQRTGWTMLGLGVSTRERNVGEVKYEVNAFV
jgi:hypothetical protein